MDRLPCLSNADDLARRTQRTCSDPAYIGWRLPFSDISRRSEVLQQDCSLQALRLEPMSVTGQDSRAG